MNADDAYNITCENTAQNRSFLYISSWDNAELETCQEDNIGPSLVLPKQTDCSLIAYLTLIYMFTQTTFYADYRHWNLVNELSCGRSGENKMFGIAPVHEFKIVIIMISDVKQEHELYFTPYLKDLCSPRRPMNN